MSKTIKYAGIAGIVSLILSIPVIIFDILESLNKLEGRLTFLYIVILSLSLISYIIFTWGFKLIAEKYQNNLLRVSSYVMIVSSILYYVYIILTLLSPNLDNIVIQIFAVAILGAASISFGIALLKLKPQFGSLATDAGVIEIITGASLLTVILSILGILLLIPLYILELMILFRAAKQIEITSGK